MKNSQIASVFILTSLAACSPGDSNEPATTTPTPDTSVETTQFDALDSWERKLYQAAYQSVIWSLPAVSSLQFQEALEGAGAPPGSLAFFGRPPQNNLRIPTFNNTTPYLFGSLDLKDGPLVLEIPAATETAKVFGSLMNIWDRALEDFGPAGADKGSGGRFLVLPPGFDRDVPVGFEIIQSDTYEIHVWLRFVAEATGDQGWQDGLAFSKTLRVYPLADADAPPEMQFFDATAGSDVIQGTPLPSFDYFRQLDRLVQEEPVQEMDLMAYGMLSTIGIQKGEEFDPDEEAEEVLTRAVHHAFTDLEEYLATGRAFATFWPGRTWGSIALTPAIIESGATWNFGDKLDYEARAFDFYYWAVGIPKYFDSSGGGATFYLMSAQDSAGERLDGAATYKLTIPADVPVKDFWSVILYSTSQRSYTLSDRFGISSKDDLEINEDGSIDLYIGPVAPDGVTSNWLATDPDDGLFVCVRFYGPTESLTNQSWKLNDIERM